MHEVECGPASAVLFQIPSEPLVDRVGNFLEALFGDREFIAERDPRVIEERAEHAAAMEDAVEVDQVENLLARLAVEREAQTCLADLDHGAGRQVVEIVTIDHDVFAQIAGLETQLCRHPARYD